jgi:hypothetical protein
MRNQFMAGLLRHTPQALALQVAMHMKQLHLMKAKALLDAWLGRRQDCIVVDG